MADSVDTVTFKPKATADYHTWWVGVRPRFGISPERIEVIEKHPYYLFITEGTGADLHGHFVVAFPKARIRSNMISCILNLKGMDFDVDEAKAFRGRNYKGRWNVTPWYNWDVVTEYMEKDPLKRIVTVKLPPQADWETFATEWMPAPNDKRLERGPSTNLNLQRLKKLYLAEDPLPVTEEDFIPFFFRLQREDKMRAIKDMTKMRQEVRYFKDVYLAEEAPSHYVGSAAKRLKTTVEEECDAVDKDAAMLDRVHHTTHPRWIPTHRI